MARQKSEDRVVPDGGVMPAKPARDGGQGKAVPVDETAVQLIELDRAVGPAAEHGADEAFGFAVGLWSVGAGA
jgi:hypothetical protein